MGGVGWPAMKKQRQRGDAPIPNDSPIDSPKASLVPKMEESYKASLGVGFPLHTQEIYTPSKKVVRIPPF